MTSYFDGYDMEITFNRDDIPKPIVEMEEQIRETTGEAFNTIHGDDKLRLNSTYRLIISFYSNLMEELCLSNMSQMSVNNRDGSLYGVVGTFFQCHRMDKWSGSRKNSKRTRILKNKNINGYEKAQFKTT